MGVVNDRCVWGWKHTHVSACICDVTREQCYMKMWFIILAIDHQWKKLIIHVWTISYACVSGFLSGFGPRGGQNGNM